MDPTESGVSECDREAMIMRSPTPTMGCCAMGKNNRREIQREQNKLKIHTAQYFNGRARRTETIFETKTNMQDIILIRSLMGE